MAPVFVEQDFALLLDDPVLVGVGDEALVLAVAELNRFATSLLNGTFRPTWNCIRCSVCATVALAPDEETIEHGCQFSRTI